MFASLADSMAALSRMLIFGSPPPLLAATVISRRIFEKSFPPAPSALPFSLSLCPHGEPPPLLPPSPFRNPPFHPLPPAQPMLAPPHRRFPAPALSRRLGGERAARPRPQVVPEVHVREVRRARV